MRFALVHPELVRIAAIRWSLDEAMVRDLVEIASLLGQGAARDLFGAEVAERIEGTVAATGSDERAERCAERFLQQLRIDAMHWGSSEKLLQAQLQAQWERLSRRQIASCISKAGIAQAAVVELALRGLKSEFSLIPFLSAEDRKALPYALARTLALPYGVALAQATRLSESWLSKTVPVPPPAPAPSREEIKQALLTLMKEIDLDAEERLLREYAKSVRGDTGELGHIPLRGSA